MKTAPPIFAKIVTLDNMSQIVHFLAAMWVVEHGAHWFGHPVIWLIAVVALAGFKEAVIDPRYESKEVAGNGWKDWSSFTIGALAGFLLGGLSL